MNLYGGMIRLILSIVWSLHFVTCDIPCAALNDNYDSVICVCNATYCDEISKIVKQPKGHYILYSTSKAGYRFHKTKGIFFKPGTPIVEKSRGYVPYNPRNYTASTTEMEINQRVKFQSMEGFGGAFTDASAILYMDFDNDLKKKLIDSYFSNNGIEFNMGRVAIGGTDFSTKPYAYNMQPEYDINLTHFSLSEEDYLYKIPFIKDAQKAATSELHLKAAAWSPPVWMKDNHQFGGVGQLLPEYYQTWADYHLKFLQEYDKENITFWGISPGNEPNLAFIRLVDFNTLGWKPKNQIPWIINHFGPTIRNSKFKNIRIIGHDDHKYLFPWMLLHYYINRDALDYVDGFGFHWYTNNAFHNFHTSLLHGLVKDKLFINTEASYGPPLQFFIDYGSWERARILIKNIMFDLNHWFGGWMWWNLILDKTGGPNWYKNFNDALIITNDERNEFIKQPMFYAMGHFSKFIPRGSVRIETNLIAGQYIENVAFKRPDDGVAFIFYNNHRSTRNLIIHDKKRGKIKLYLPADSVHSLVYW